MRTTQLVVTALLCTAGLASVLLQVQKSQEDPVELLDASSRWKIYQAVAKKLGVSDPMGNHAPTLHDLPPPKRVVRRLHAHPKPHVRGDIQDVAAMGLAEVKAKSRAKKDSKAFKFVKFPVSMKLKPGSAPTHAQALAAVKILHGIKSTDAKIKNTIHQAKAMAKKFGLNKRVDQLMDAKPNFNKGAGDYSGPQKAKVKKSTPAQKRWNYMFKGGQQKVWRSRNRHSSEENAVWKAMPMGSY